MKAKQIIFTKPNVAEYLEVELSDTVGADEVLVKTEFSAISAGTERANLIGDPFIAGVKKEPDYNFPRTLGYSSSGVVTKVGKNVTHLVPGDKVIVHFGGCHRSYNLVKASTAYKIEFDSISTMEAAFLPIAGFSMEGVRKTRLEIGESVLVAGLGLLGLFAVQFAKAAGGAPVIAADLNPERRKLALELGADYAFDPSEEGYSETVKNLTKGGVSCAVEVTGVMKGLYQTLECIAPLGRITLLGCTRHSNDSILFYQQIHAPGVSIIGAHTNARPKVESRPGNWTIADDFYAMQKLLASGRMNVTTMIHQISSPRDAEKVFDVLAHHPEKFPIGVVFDWRNEE
ncbi:MAG: theronine dehydrogenase [Ruminococcaceae bacterium]|nr:theronine dehydrogenase [Oscillospiraceae bacterium]